MMRRPAVTGKWMSSGKPCSSMIHCTVRQSQPYASNVGCDSSVPAIYWRLMKVHPPPISVSDLLDRRIVESERLELKAGWNPAAIMRSVCAFGNGFQNLGEGEEGGT
jgi:hypothetical protein